MLLICGVTTIVAPVLLMMLIITSGSTFGYEPPPREGDIAES